MLFLFFQVAEVTFNFWYKLSEELYHKNESSLNELFQPYIQRLIIALSTHCQMDPDHVSTQLSVVLVEQLPQGQEVTGFNPSMVMPKT